MGQEGAELPTRRLPLYTCLDGFACDADGNLTEHLRDFVATRYEYDAENRLVAVDRDDPWDTGAQGRPIPGVRVEVTYDYLGRRVRKRVLTGEAASATWTPTSETLYVYDGWNLVQELDGDGSVRRAYVWGLDLSGSLQGAGGIAGLLARIDAADLDPAATSCYTYDGNGNASEPLRAADGAQVAHYEYGPFGKLVYADGVLAQDNRFRFSTKYHDDETGLLYYGYRYYSPELGRWLTRDPIEEHGGPNLYGFVLNAPTTNVDALGQAVCRDGQWRRKKWEAITIPIPFTWAVLQTGRCTCWWLCDSCSGTIWSGNVYKLPTTMGISTYTTGPKSATDCICPKPGPETGCCP